MKETSAFRLSLEKLWKLQDYHVKVLIICVFITYSAISFYSPWYLCRFGYKLFLFNIFFLLPYTFTFYLIHRKAYLAGKLWFSISYFFHIFSVSVLFFSKETGYHYYHLSLIPVSYILFSPDEKKYRLFMNCLNIAAFLFSIFFDLNIFYKPLSGTEQLVSFYITLIFNIAGITWTLYIFSIELMNAEKKLKFLASHDQLTSLLNRRAFIDFAEQELKWFKRTRRIFTVVLIDIDYFKRINDTYGHSAGDFVLSEFSSALRKNLRETDILARFGGEEFICLMPGIDSSSAYNIIDRIRGDKSNFQVRYRDSLIEYSFSAGVYSPDTDFENDDLVFDHIFDKADSSLYTAKQSGRNRVCVYEN